MPSKLSAVSSGILLVCAAGLAQASSVTLVSDGRAASVSASASDAAGTAYDSESDAPDMPGAAFDTVVRLLVQSPLQRARSESWATQSSTVGLSGHGRLQLSGVLAAGTVSITDYHYEDLGAAPFQSGPSTFADPISTFRIDFRAASQVHYELTLNIHTRGDSYASFRAFDFSEYAGLFGGADNTWTFAGTADPGLHSIFAQVNAPSDLATGRSSATLDFDLTATVAPLPAAFAPAAALMLGLAARRRR